MTFTFTFVSIDNRISISKLGIQGNFLSLIKGIYEKPTGNIILSASLVAQSLKCLPANAGDLGLIPGSGRSPGEGNDNPLLYSCLENPVDRRPGELQPTGSQRVGHD